MPEEGVLERTNDLLKRKLHECAEANAKLRQIVAVLLPYAEPPYFPAIYRGVSKVYDPRQAELREVYGLTDEEEYARCWFILGEGEEKIGTVSQELAAVLQIDQLVTLNQSYHVVAPIPDEEIDNLIGVKEAHVVDILGNAILIHAGHDNFVVAVSEKLKKGLGDKPLAVGDRVLVFSRCIVKILERRQLQTTKNKIKKVGFADIGGLDSQIQEIRDLLGLDFDPESAKAMGKGFPRGGVLHGPPGGGKTLLVTALANELGYFLQVIGGPEIESKWVGDTPLAIRESFYLALKNRPAILFIDEADALFPVRGRSLTRDYTTAYTTQLGYLLDSIEETSGVFVILATNRLDMLDPSLTRPGRCDKIIYIPRPSRKAAEVILKIHFQGRPVGESGEPAEVVNGWIQAIVREIFTKNSSKDPAVSTFLFKAFFDREEKEFYFKDFVSGALLKNIVDRIVERALKRMREAGIKADDPAFGIRTVDLENIVREVLLKQVPRDDLTLNQWLVIDGYSQARQIHRGPLMSKEK